MVINGTVVAVDLYLGRVVGVAATRQLVSRLSCGSCLTSTNPPTTRREKYEVTDS